MSVYVDDIQDTKNHKVTGYWPYPQFCHMVADTLEELFEAARVIGLNRRWFQGPPAHIVPHFDLTVAMRRRAIGAGALDVCKGGLVEVAWLNCLRWWRILYAPCTMDNGRNKKAKEDEEEWAHDKSLR